ncbi:VWA domain-containing protein [Planktothricoides raciborskii]|uniref:VWA domain-containing protein n=1 Tax=Planktothricoides raciborskii GIHE-MW2 TaxID=2792601 RepID=A0AAU8JD17_9CYAN
MFDLQLDWDLPAKISSQNTNHVLRVRMTPIADAPKMPLHLAIALDTSSSMHGEKLERAKAACEMVIRQLRDSDPQNPPLPPLSKGGLRGLSDRLSLASFATNVSPLINATSGNTSQTREAIAQLRANGVTRTDLALKWLQQALPPEPGVARVAILITDGHPTNNQGQILENTDSLIDMARQCANSGINLCTVGLGNAAHFNTDFLVTLSDRGRGAFIYADTPSSLEPQLQERLSSYQAIAFDAVQLILTPLAGSEVESFCRYRPEYLPLEETAPNELILTALSSTEPTDVLILVNVPPLGFNDPSTSKPVLNVQLQGPNMNPVRATAAIEYTTSYRKAQTVNQEVDRDRLGWEINLNSTELPSSHDPNRTGELLTNIQVAAYKSGRTDIMQQAAQQLQELQNSGKLNPDRMTSLLRDTRKTGEIL